jgi:hypothetical protein
MDTDEVKRSIDLLGQGDWELHRRLGLEIMANPEALALVLDAVENHPRPKVRRYCADLLDHHGDDRCVETLFRCLSDPIPKIRWQAVHSLSCQRCKATPLQTDVVPVMISVLESDPTRRVREEAIYALGQCPPTDERATGALRAALGREAHPHTRGLLHDTLYRRDPAYWEQAITAAKARTAAVAQIL